MKKLNLLLVLTLLLCVSCGNEANEPEVTTTDSADVTTEEVVTDIYENLRGLDFDGYEFNILTYDNESWETYAAPEAETGDVLNDSAFKRNLEVMELLNVDINLIRDANSESSFRNMVLAGDSSEYDMIIFWSPGERSSFISGGLTYDVSTMPYMNLDAEWYNQTANDAYTIAGKQFFFVSDLSFPVQQHFRILFNKQLAEDYKIESPYDAVFDGSWTIERLLSDCKGIYSDLNGDVKAGLEDRYGMVLNHAFASVFPLNAGEIQVYSTDDGFELNLYSERIVKLVEYIVGFNSNEDIYVNTNANAQYDIFYAGNALYMPYGSDPALLRDVEFDFGYLPYPKLDENQEDYVVWSAGGMMAIPASAENVERTGAVIEALSIGSNKYVKDAFIEKYIEGKILRDDESQQIYRMMRDAATYDLSYNIDPSGTLSNYAYYSYFMQQGSADVASRYAQISERIEESYSKLYDSVVNQ